MTQKPHYLIIGLGVTGLSVASYLIENGAQLTITDNRLDPPQLDELLARYPRPELLLGEITIPEYITTIILSPGLAVDDPALAIAHARNIPIIGDIELFARVVDKPVLAVTGSNGKSTVTTLLGQMAMASGLQAGVGGNLGVAALDLLDANNDCYILELSSFQLETLYSLRPQVVTVLNVSPDHMDRYQDLTAYQQAKQRIYNHAQHAVINREDKLTFAPPELSLSITSFGLDQPESNNYGVLTESGVRWLAKGKTKLMPVSELAMLGEHNVTNALAALAMGEIAGFKLDAMLAVLREFGGLEHRCEKILIAQNIVWVNDSKGTNVAATVAALQGLANSITGKWLIILGGVGKNADFTPLIKPVEQYCRAVILIGNERQQLWDLLHAVVPCFMANDLTQVIDIARQQAQNGDGVLLSPACASFDMFDNYVHRGNLFKQNVQQLIGKQYATAAG